MGRIKHRKRELSLSLIYLKYLLLLSSGIVLTGVCALFAFQKMSGSGFLYSADQVEKEIADARDRILAADEITAQMIPELCQYVVFDFEGNRKGGNVDGDASLEWKIARGGAAADMGYCYQVLRRNDGYCVFKYRMITQYRSEALRRYLPPPSVMITAGTLLSILFIIIWAAARFGRLLKTELYPIIETAEKVQKHELDFSVRESNIKEINRILAAMEKMRGALKNSLESQWKADQIRKEQISAMAHDLKTPLTIIRGNAELLYDTPLTSAQKECADFIDSSSIQMQHYLRQLIEAAKTGSVLQLQYQDIGTAAFLPEIKMQAKGLCAVKNISLEWKEDHTPGWIRIDREHFVRAVLNILSNAVEHTPAGGKIRFATYQDEDFLYLSICDTGTGFSPDALKHAAEQFYMDENSRTSRMHYGLGLYIADSVITRHGGSVILDNSQETGGAEVLLKIPCNCAGRLDSLRH